MIWRGDRGLEWLEADLGGKATAAFGSRNCGLIHEDFEALKTGMLAGADRNETGMATGPLAAELGLEPDRIDMGIQVHGSDLAWNGAEGRVRPETGAPLPEADGQLTDLPGRGQLVFVADCLPVALLGDRGVAMLHCGWRGLAAGIIEAASARIGAKHAAIGPGIGPCCFEVGPEVEAAFTALGPGLMQGRNLDLPEVARRKLNAVGSTRVDSADICTYCDSRFFSYRRDGAITGRQPGIAWLN